MVNYGVCYRGVGYHALATELIGWANRWSR